MDFSGLPKPFCSSSVYDDEDAYSPLTHIQEKNPNVVVRSIKIDDDDVCFPTFTTAQVISALLNVFYYQNSHICDTLSDAIETINEAVTCANVVYFKIVTRMESQSIRDSCTSIISQSIGTHDIVHFDGDNDDDDVTSVLKMDNRFIEQKINDIINNGCSDKYIATMDHFINEFKTYNISRRFVMKQFDFVIDNKYCAIKKKILILCGIFRNNESEISSLLEMLMYVEGLDQHYAESQLYEMRSIHKSIWHLFYAMDVPFLVMMLLWIENAYNKNPHEIIVSAKPLFQYLRECIRVNEPKERFINKKLTPNIENIKDQEKLTRSRLNNGKGLDYLIATINDVSDVSECDECGQYMKFILSNSDGVASVHVPPVEAMSCELCKKLGGIKRQIHNLNKTTEKKFNAGESKKASSVPPIFKQILSLAGTMCNLIHHQENDADGKKTKKPYDCMYESTEQLIDTADFSKPFINKDEIQIDTRRRLTMLPLDFNDILSSKKYKSFTIEFNNQINNKTVLTVHRIFIKEEKKHGFIVVDLYDKNTNDQNAIGIVTFCPQPEDVIRYFNTSMYSNKKFTASIHIYKFTKEQRTGIMDALHNIVK